MGPIWQAQLGLGYAHRPQLGLSYAHRPQLGAHKFIALLGTKFVAH